eukprot:scaffold51383_cov67-Cyclotella_meneghiniana.AAC.1
MKRQCDSTSSASERPASKLANVGASTPNSTSNDDHLRYHLDSFGLLPTKPTDTLNSNEVNAATLAGTSTHSDNPNTHFDFGVDIDELLGDELLGEDYPLLSPKSPLFKSTTLSVPPSSSFDAQPTNLSMDMDVDSCLPPRVTEEAQLKAGDTSSSEIKEAKCVQMLKAGDTFSNPKALMDTIDGVFTSTGALKSSMCRKTKQSFGPDDEMEIFGYVYGVGGKNKKTGKTTSPKRGRCYCNVEGCNWNVAFTFSSKTNSYVIKDEDFDADSDFKCHFLLEHNHPIENEILD